MVTGHQGPRWSLRCQKRSRDLPLPGYLPVARQTCDQPQGGRWNADAQSLIWPLAGSHAQIVGDVGQAQLADLAMRVTVVSGHHLAALDGFTAAATTTYRFPLIHEMRYETVDLGQESKLGTGEVWTGVTTGASFEFELLRVRAVPGGSAFYKSAGVVRGKPAIYARAPDSNWILLGSQPPARWPTSATAAPCPRPTQSKPCAAWRPNGARCRRPPCRPGTAAD